MMRSLVVLASYGRLSCLAFVSACGTGFLGDLEISGGMPAREDTAEGNTSSAAAGSTVASAPGDSSASNDVRDSDTEIRLDLPGDDGRYRLDVSPSEDGRIRLDVSPSEDGRIRLDVSPSEDSGDIRLDVSSACDTTYVSGCCCFSAQEPVAANDERVVDVLCEAEDLCLVELHCLDDDPFVADCEQLVPASVEDEDQLTCALRALAAGEPGRVSYVVNPYDGAGYSQRNVDLYLTGDGGAYLVSQGYEDQQVSSDPVRRHALRDPGVFDACAAAAALPDRLACLLDPTTPDDASEQDELCLPGYLGRVPIVE